MRNYGEKKKIIKMIQLIDFNHSDIWDNIVRSFPNYEVYYLIGYVKGFHIHGDGAPYLLYYKSSDEQLRAIYVFMKRQTYLSGVYDAITPYGYGGVLFDGNIDNEHLYKFYVEYSKKMSNESIVDNFVRYNPIAQNATIMKSIVNVIDLGKTVEIDLSSPDVIWQNIISKNRNMIRKAEKNGIEIKHGKGIELFVNFRQMYNETMRRDKAETYYFFDDDFYLSIHNDLRNNYEMFYATKDNKIVAMSIMLFANGHMHYHLSGSIFEYRSLAPSNLLLYKAALWGYEQGFSKFHLGGGVGSGEDNLYKFKAAFNRNSNCQYSIGKEIFDNKKYNELVMLRQENDKSFNPNSSFFPLYRS